MITIPIPYHKDTMPLTLPRENFKALIAPRNGNGNFSRDEEDILREALASPINAPTLRELSMGKRRITLVTSDHTRNMPSSKTLPILLEEIRAGNPEAEITLLIGTGLHRPTSEAEQRQMFGDGIVDREIILVNDAFRREDFVDVGTLPSGASCKIQRAAVETDLLVTEGFIEPHFFAGFSGGRKSILPGICAAETINENHCFDAIAHPRSAAGVLAGNPIHEDMVAAARLAKVAFIFNVTLDHSKRISGAFAGDLETAHQAGVDFLTRELRCEAVQGDIVVTSNGGYPLDQNLYQSPKAVATAEKCAGTDGVIIMFASCVDGIGGERFEEVMRWGTPRELERRMAAIPPKETIPEMWCAQVYARILKKHPVILVSDHPDPDGIRALNLIPAKSGQEALDIAFQLKGSDASVVVIPDGVCTLIV
ncbi:MAG TPA: nickel-dependent lactate racemase [Clostridiales bacterium]|nr:nickel-dependent lactate racemase [Clostridiales bacterium]